MKKGSLRFTEDQFRTEAEKRDRWKAGVSPVGVGPGLVNSVTNNAGATITDKGTRLASALPPQSGCEPPPAPIPTLTQEVPERDVLKEVLAACLYHPRVAWVERMNSGVMQQGGRWVRFGFVGCPDIIGQMRDGRFLAVECKRVGKDATEKQLEFLGRVYRNHGLAFVARSAADARNALNEYGDAA